MSELAFIPVSAFFTDESEAGFAIRKAMSDINPFDIELNLSTHEHLSY